MREKSEKKKREHERERKDERGERRREESHTVPLWLIGIKTMQPATPREDNINTNNNRNNKKQLHNTICIPINERPIKKNMESFKNLK